MGITTHLVVVEFQGHVGAALAAYSPIAFVSLRLGWVRLALVGGVVTVALASLPDVDVYVSRVAHRGPLHTVWFAGVVGTGCAVAFRAGGDPSIALRTAGLTTVASTELAVFGFVVGTTVILSHLAVDALTPMGIAPFEPVFRRRYSLGVTRSADPIANRRLLLLGLATFALTVAIGGVALSPVR